MLVPIATGGIGSAQATIVHRFSLCIAAKVQEMCNVEQATAESIAASPHVPTAPAELRRTAPGDAAAQAQRCWCVAMSPLGHRAAGLSLRVCCYSATVQLSIAPQIVLTAVQWAEDYDRQLADRIGTHLP